MEYAPHQQRVVDEKAELDERRGKLDTFIQSNYTFVTLSAEEQSLLKQQRAAMTGYSDILGKRIELFAK